MERLGTWLRQTREARSETLDEASAGTRIRARFIEILEAGEFAALPGGEVQVRGFLRIYARHLGLSADDVLTRYEAERKTNPTRAQEHVTAWSAPSPPPRRANPVVLLAAAFGIVVLLAVIAGVAYALSQLPDAGAAAPAAAALAADNAPLLDAGASALSTPAFAVDPEGGVTLAIEATEHVWVCVTVDGATAFEGLMAPGQVETWRGEEMVIVDTGNGAGVSVTVNNQSQGVMGGRGEISTRAWIPAGESAAPSLAATP